MKITCKNNFERSECDNVYSQVGFLVILRYFFGNMAFKIKEHKTCWYHHGVSMLLLLSTIENFTVISRKRL